MTNKNNDHKDLSLFWQNLLNDNAIKLNLPAEGLLRALEVSIYPLVLAKKVAQQLINTTREAILNLHKNLFLNFNEVLIIRAPYTAHTIFKSSFALATFLNPLIINKFAIKSFRMIIVLAIKNEEYEFEILAEKIITKMQDQDFVNSLLKQTNITSLISVLKSAS